MEIAKLPMGHANSHQYHHGSMRYSKAASAEASSCKEQYRQQQHAQVGFMTLLGQSNGSGSPNLTEPRRVEVRVYRTSFEHFAVIYPRGADQQQPLGVLNLRHTSLERLGRDGLLLRQHGYDSPMTLTLLLDEPEEVDCWIAALAARTSSPVHHCSLPIVEEEDV
ncbi:hypothetical protein TKK_0006921 [Trichogramma kaykai]